MEFRLADGVGIIEAMKHQPVGDLISVVVAAFASSPLTRLNVTLTLAGTEENVAATTFPEHTLGDIEMLAFITVIHEVAAVEIPLEMCHNLITNL